MHINDTEQHIIWMERALVLAERSVAAGNHPFGALLVVDKDGTMLGAFAAVPEGEGYIVGADMNERFPDEAGEFTGAATPRVVQLGSALFCVT